MLEGKASSAHKRVDKLEAGIRDDLKEIKQDLKELSAHMNRGKGWAAATMLLAGTLGASIGKLLTLLIK